MNFADPGLWVWSVVNFDWNDLRRAHEAGFKWIAMQICSGQEPVILGDYRDLIDRARDFGMDVGGFGWLDSQPELEAETAHRLLDVWGLDGFIANGEKPISYSQETKSCPECFGYSAKWVSRWQTLRGSFPLAFSSYADFSRADIHYVPWINAGAAAMPQVYWNEFDWATPERGVQGALDVKQPWNGPPYGWPVEKIHVTFGNYKSGTRPVPTPGEYAANLLKTSARGFNVYLGELCDEQEFLTYKELIPTLCAPKRIGLTENELPYTGPYYGPSHPDGKHRGPTAKALKRALDRIGVFPFPRPDDRYNLLLEQAMGRWQDSLGIKPASGQYGQGSWRAMRTAVVADGTYAMDKTARDWVKKESVG